MPHLILEYSANVPEKNGFHTLFMRLHTLLAQSLPTELSGCRSRALECVHYCVGDGNEHNAFIHLTLKIMPGRSEEKRMKLGNELVAALQEYCSKNFHAQKIQLSVEMLELQPTYFKAYT